MSVKSGRYFTNALIRDNYDHRLGARAAIYMQGSESVHQIWVLCYTLHLLGIIMITCQRQMWSFIHKAVKVDVKSERYFACTYIRDI